MDDAFDRVLTRYLSRAAAEQKLLRTGGQEVFARRDEFLLEVGEEVGRLMHALIVARGAKAIVEIGTSYGFPRCTWRTLPGAREVPVVTFELSREKQAYAQEQIAEAGLSAHVEWRCGDAVGLLEAIAEPIDFALIDLWKELYVPCLERLHPRLADGAVIVADNMLHPPMARPEAGAYRAAVRAKANLQSVLLPVGSGIELSCLWRSDPDCERGTSV